MSQEQTRKILEFCSKPENAKIAEFIKKGTYNTSTQEFILSNDQGTKVVFKIEDLDNNSVDFSPLFANEMEEEKLEELTDISENNMQPNNQVESDEVDEILDENIAYKSDVVTLSNLYEAIKSGDINKVDSLLAKFAVNPNTGLVDIDRAIGIATNNTLNEAVECVKNNTDFSSDLSNYDISGNLIVKQNQNTQDVVDTEICDKSFNNILLFVEAAKLKGTIYDEDKKAKAKQIYTTMFNDKLKVLGLKDTEVKDLEKSDDVPKKEVTKELALRPTMDLKKAGFADIFILTMIVIVYAVIIANLIIKLK